MYAEDAMRDKYDRMYSQYSATGPYSDDDDSPDDETCDECGQHEDECICDLEEEDDADIRTEDEG
jgi:DTW domain-containing protein YfiP